MGGSSSKIKDESDNDKKKFNDEQNETNYKDKKDSKDIFVNKNDNNLNKIEDISNDIEELTLDKNGVLINEKDIIKPRSELHSEKKPTNKISLINVRDTFREKEEKIILYSEKESQKIITNFYDDFIEIIYCFNSRKTFVALVKSINEKHLYKFNPNKFPKTKESQEFLESFKYSAIIIVCFIFLVKDYNLYEHSGKKIKENLEQFIYTCLDNVDRSIIFSLKIISFVQRYKKYKKSLYGCTSGIIKTLFKNKILYKHILNCLEQMLNNINSDTTQDIITKINDSILYFYNASNINLKNSIKKEKINTININSNKKSIKKLKNDSKNNNINKILNNNKNSKKEETKDEGINLEAKKKDNNNNIEDTNAPFIKKELDKKFCLVLDIDETLSHMIKLPFGNYFLVRPGVIDLLKELYYYYEIDIFTAALKHYADNILNKLDKDNIYISYRLYRCHCTYEDGKSVKKLSLIGRDLNKIVFVDDLKRNAKYNMKNLALVSKWIDDVYDNEIINLKNKLKFIALCGKYDEDITKGLIEENLAEDINNNI
jgi:hypothetical protein